MFRRVRRIPKWLVGVPPFRAALNRVPPRCRPALFHETFYNVGSGAFVAMFGLSLAALKSDQIFVPGGTKEHLMFVAAMFGGSSLLSPLGRLRRQTGADAVVDHLPQFAHGGIVARYRGIHDRDAVRPDCGNRVCHSCVSPSGRDEHVPGFFTRPPTAARQSVG